ncbi:SRPBCC family protein [Saccharomonospora glauca]|jgi:uncharacterized protein YndB with AHSA1/START domain|uniref:Activator of Hsp90 ATPase homologue 1/2-like C-terminal domain-containing protein n=1 Tax=Saccharomonospora glauca K62 TaxID=928724 RepID=I1D223_9PSEU|nr:SRPBCC domain-containing protein [Saccharomonospora glauca]EIE98997.1 hypothetical protein SacglDRAFT_02092 [Saccharomonospora glauca K62]
MPVTHVHKDTEALTLTFVAEFPADVNRIWRIWEDPRQLERWWGPPSWPATFEQHDFTVGGRSRYHMTGPDGDKAHGWWRITAIEAPHRLEFDDGFADDNGEPSPDMPTIHCVVTLEPTDSGTRMTTVSRFDSADQLEQLLTMGMEEGMREAMSQIDDLVVPTAG